MRRLMFLLLVACGGGATTTPTTVPTAPTTGDPSCPVEVSGTSVTVEDTDTGAAFVFVTTGDVAELRKRAAAMAQKHNDHHAAMGPLPDGNDAGTGHDHAHHGHGGDDHGKHANHTSGGMIAIHSKATASDVEGGAKVAFMSGASDIGKLQSELRMHAKHYAAGTCEMK